jgi:hypothetical protein
MENRKVKCLLCGGEFLEGGGFKNHLTKSHPRFFYSEEILPIVKRMYDAGKFAEWKDALVGDMIEALDNWLKEQTYKDEAETSDFHEMEREISSSLRHLAEMAFIAGFSSGVKAARQLERYESSLKNGIKKDPQE